MITTNGNNTKQTRGERNNNPGNILKSATIWKGMLQINQNDPRFVTFIAPEFGIRAIGIIIKNYNKKYGLNTVKALINRWAPPVENNTDAYVDCVADDCGVKEDEVVDVQNPDVLFKVVKAIIQHENGRVVYTDEFIRNALTL